jgi:hypothetical protein
MPEGSGWASRLSSMIVMVVVVVEQASVGSPYPNPLDFLHYYNYLKTNKLPTNLHHNSALIYSTGHCLIKLSKGNSKE